MREQIKRAEGSVQGVEALPADVRELFRTAWELPQKALIDVAAARSPYIDQSQSLNLFMSAPTIGKVSSMYLYAWKAGPRNRTCFDDTMVQQVKDMLVEAVECEVQFAADLLEQGVSGMSLADMREYLQHVADRRLAQLGIDPVYGSKNPFAFMELQDVQELSNFFERKVSAYQVGVTGSVSFDDDF
ncbi:MAG: ribonucleoside-diphosphate reductase beta chain [Actinoplanes sp.]|nr:ribonucleoside-diphosphate reductase beta chain [Actinoplanes sp.]